MNEASTQEVRLTTDFELFLTAAFDDSETFGSPDAVIALAAKTVVPPGIE